MKPNNCTSYITSQQSSYNNSSSSYGNSRIRVIRLRRHSNVPLGFSVRGGREHGTGIFVSEVRVGSEAHHQGLLVGDQILRINGFNIEHAIHEEVLALLRAKPGVVIKVKSMGMIPVKDTKKDPLTWKLVEPGPSSSSSECNGMQPVCSSVANEGLEMKISIPAIGTSGLGCSIVKGPPGFPGIYIQSVKAGCLAEKAGLQVGDRIMEMNGHNFTNLDFTDAVAVLKSSKQMSLVLCKGLGLDLFPEEKLKRSAELHNIGRHGENKKLSVVQEEDAKEERDTKKMNGQSSRVKNGSDLKRPNAVLEREIKLNGNTSCLKADNTPKEVPQDAVSFINMNNSVKISASVHVSSGAEEEVRYIGNCPRESGDGMDYDSVNENKSVQKNTCHSWNGEKYEDNDNTTFLNDNKHRSHSVDNSCSEDEACHKSSMKLKSEQISVMNVVNGHKHDFLSEIRRHGDKNSVTSDEKSEMSSLSSDDYLGISQITSNLGCLKPQTEFLKRKQHELLMEEFREVHKKMFGQGPQKFSKPPKSGNTECQDQSNLYKRRQQVRKDRVTPPPPPPLSDLLSSVDNLANRVAAPLHEELDETVDDEDNKVAYKRRQREPPITDSRDPEPKPPQTYFDKSDGGQKPLVTIGTYPNNSQQNRFLCSDSANIKSRRNQSENKLDCTNVKIGQNMFKSKCDIFPSQIKGQLSISVHQKNSINSSSESSTVPSSSSSEPRSPTSESVASSDSLFQPSSPVIRNKSHIEYSVPTNEASEIVPNSFKETLSQFCKSDERTIKNNKGNQKLLPKSFQNHNADSNKSTRTINSQMKCQKMDSQNELLKGEAEGREIKTITLKKNGPLNFRVEGGINSDMAGKITISEVWEGSCITEGGQIEVGDQILMVDNTKLTGLSLTAANVALRNANSNANKEMKLIIAKSFKEN